MTHQECQDRLLDFAYGELGRREAGDVAAHLAGCPACAGVYRRIAGVREVMGQLEPEPPPGQGERLILAAARDAAERRREARPFLGLPPWTWKASAAAVVVAAVAGVSVKIATLRERSAREETSGVSLLGPTREEAAPAERGSDVARAAPAPPPGAPAPAEAKAAKAVRPPAAAPGPVGPERRRAFAAEAPAARAPAPAAAPAAVAEANDAARREERAPAKQAPEVATGRAPRPAVSGLLSREAAPPEPQVAAPPGPQVATPRAKPRGSALRAARGVVQDVERRLRSGQLVESGRPYQACGPAEDAERRLYAGPDGRVVKYVRQSGSAEVALTFEQYYDAEGRLRHVLVHGGAVNGAVVEHRIWLDADGSRLLEERRFRRGRYPFPETWPEAELSLRAPDASALRCGAP